MNPVFLLSLVLLGRCWKNLLFSTDLSYEKKKYVLYTPFLLCFLLSTYSSLLFTQAWNRIKDQNSITLNPNPRRRGMPLKYICFLYIILEIIVRIHNVPKVLFPALAFFAQFLWRVYLINLNEIEDTKHTLKVGNTCKITNKGNWRSQVKRDGEKKSHSV